MYSKDAVVFEATTCTKSSGRQVLGEVLTCEREPDNASDRYTVAVKKEGTVVGHLSQKLTSVCSLFL